MSQPTPTCAACGEGLPPRQPGRGGRNRKYHKACDPNKHRHEPLLPRECRRCGVEFQPKSKSNAYCSAYCKGHVAPHPERRCEFSGCGELFRPVNTRQKTCSPMHARKAWQERNLEHDADVRRNVYHRRRAKKKGTTSGAPVIRAEIAARDNWTCHLCGSAIPTEATWPNPLSLSLDHVIPLSRGGVHDPSNVKAAHLRCNIAKGDRIAA